MKSPKYTDRHCGHKAGADQIPEGSLSFDRTVILFRMIFFYLHGRFFLVIFAGSSS